MEKYKYISPHFWHEYSKKLEKRILRPRAVGTLSPKEGMRLIIAEEGSLDMGSFVRLYLLVDNQDGVIADAKYQAFGETALIGAIEALSELLIRKTYHQAERITSDLIETHMNDKSEHRSFPQKAAGHINFVLNLIDTVVERCQDIPLSEEYLATPLDLQNLVAGEYPDWKALSDKEKLATIIDLVEKEVQPYIELDEGKVVIKELKDDLKVIIGYEGSCTTCYSSTGSTLSAIQAILRAKIHPELVVIADL